MRGSEIAELIALIAIFLIGVTFGVIAAVSQAIKREDRRRSLTHRPPDAGARGTRMLTGVGSRDVRNDVSHDVRNDVSPPERTPWQP